MIRKLIHGLDMFLVWFFRQSEGKLVGLRGRKIRGGVGYGGDNQVDNAFVEK